MVRSLNTSNSRIAAFELEGFPEGSGSARGTYEADVDLDQSGHAWLPATLPILMRVTDAVSFTDQLDPVGLERSAQAQELLRAWYPQLHHVTIDAERARAGSPGSGVGCFFSGGVDSFYSVLERREEITHLIFVHGFDIDFDDEHTAGTASTALRAAASALGIPLISVRTDIRRLSDRWSGWGEQYHGAALASIGLLLAGHVGRVIVPSTFPSTNLTPWGSHPDLDPLWSTSRVSLEHHGVEQQRTDKIAAIAADPIALRYLRVCWQRKSGEYNCGQCSKCIRTMAVLRAYGALEQCATFPSRIDSRPLRLVRKPKPYELADARSILALLVSRGIDEPDLVRDLRGLVRRGEFWRAARGARARLRRGVGQAS